MWNEERKRIADAERSVAVARNLQAEWQAQSGATQEQEAYARQLWEKEDAAEVQLASFRTLAEKLQAEWQAAAGENDQDEAFNPRKVSPFAVEHNRNSVNIAPFGRPAVFAITKDTPSRYSQVVADPHGSHVEISWVKEQRRTNLVIPQTPWSTALVEGIPDVICSLLVELQQRFLEAQKSKM